MGFIDKIISLPTAQTNRRSFKRPSITVTTNDFMYLKPVFSREMMPLQKTDINMSVFSRLAPLVSPAYARCKFVNRCYFVPYRVVFPNFNRMISQEKTSDGAVITSVPSLQQTDIFEMFWDDSQHDNYFVIAGTDSAYDLAYMPYGLGQMVYMKFTKRGKIAYDTLINLGYNIPYVYALTPEMTEEQWNIKFSALPLLCLGKVWFDWYRNNKYEPLVNSYYVEKLFNHQTPFTLVVDEIKNALLLITEVSYPLDYFTAASRNPVTPSVGEPTQSISDPTVPNLGPYRGQVRTNVSNSDSTPVSFREGSTSVAPAITDSLIKILNKMTDYLQRDGLVGGKTLDRLLAHYGVRLESEVLRRSVYIGRQEQPITIGDVTQTSATVPESGQTVLGYQAGRGQTINPSSGHFEYETKEFGQLLIVSQVVPEISYYQGVKRELLHINRFDFFTPEYDCLGPQAVARCELYNGPSDVQNSVDYQLWYNNFWDASFGYVPSRYMEYKHSCNQDVLSGDFRCNLSGRTELRHYHQFRQIFAKSFGDDHSIFTSKKFDHIVSDVDQFDRIFANTSDLFDHFISFYDFQVVDFMPCKPAFEGYDFGDDEEHRLRQTVAKNGTMF